MTHPRTHVTPDRGREIAARILDDAMRALDIGNTTLASYLLVDERLVRDLRTGEKPITLGRFVQMPATLQGEILLRLDAERGDTGGPVSRDVQAAVTVGVVGEVATAIGRAMADGHVTEAEVRDLIAPALAKLDRVARPLRTSEVPS